MFMAGIHHDKSPRSTRVSETHSFGKVLPNGRSTDAHTISKKYKSTNKSLAKSISPVFLPPTTYYTPSHASLNNNLFLGAKLLNSVDLVLMSP
ncbi:hypothetical protein DMENIID0001_034030 [Sergentomyia squamirostris]